MFFFGDQESLFELYISKAETSGGPGIPRGPLDELSLKELSLCAIYLRIAYKMAKNEDAERSVIDEIVAEYDQVFRFRARNDGKFYKRVALGQMDWLGGYSEENITKYKILAGMREKR